MADPADGDNSGPPMVLHGSVTAVATDFSSNEVGEPTQPCPNSVGEPGFWEGLIPIWGSGRAAVNDFQNGRWGWGLVNTALAVSDVFLVKSLVTAGGKLLVKTAGKEALELGEKQLAKQAEKEVAEKALTEAEQQAAAKAKKAEQLAKNKAVGEAYEKKVEQDLVNEGHEVLGKQVTVKTPKSNRRVDILIRDGQTGEIRAIEAKSGNASRNAAQKAKDAAMESQGGTITGKNAPAGLKGQNLKIKTEVR